MTTAGSNVPRALRIAPCALLLIACACQGESDRGWRRAPSSLPPLVLPAELAAHVAKGDIIVFDTRPRAEYRRGHIEGAWPLPLGEAIPHRGVLDGSARRNLEDVLAASAFSPGAAIAVADGGGEAGLRRAATGCWLLALAGARACSLLVGGVPAFRDAGGAMRAGDPAPAGRTPTVRIRARPFPLARFEEVRTAISSPDGAFVDVRPARSEGAIPGALSWPLPELPSPEPSIDLSQLRRSADDAGLFAERDLVVVGDALEDGAWGWFLLRHVLGVRGARLYPGGIAAWRRSPSLPYAPG